MIVKIITRMPLIASLLVAVFGFKYLVRQSPESLGFQRPEISDRALLELTLDDMRQSIRAGEPSALHSLLAENYAEAVRSGDGSLGEAPSRDLALRIVELAGHADLQMVVTDVEVQERRARVGVTVAQRPRGTRVPVALQFEKAGPRWQLVASDGLFSELMETDPLNDLPTLQHVQEGGFELHDDAESGAGQSFIWQPVSKDHHIDKVTKRLTLKELDRQLFQKPYAGVLYSSVTQTSGAPFFSARYVQLVTDPGWNRLLYGDFEGWIKAYRRTGAGSEALNRPHGLDRDSQGRVYVADTGNHRAVVLRLVGNGPDTELQFEFTFGAGDLMHPYDVAWDDSGTPFDPEDDLLWVADTGNHRIVGYALSEWNASQRYTLGSRGKAAGHFFSPKAVSVGRFNGVSDGSIYVADTGNRRLVKLRRGERDLEWVKSSDGDGESQFLSVDVDHWGNVYAVDRTYRRLVKFSARLEPLASLAGEDTHLVFPVNVGITFGEVALESGERFWAGYDQTFVLEDWTERSGAERYQLGVDLRDLRLTLAQDLDQLVLESRLTDHAEVHLSVIDERTQRPVRQMPLGWLVPGEKTFLWDRRDDLGWQVEPGYYRVQVTAASSYGTLTATREIPQFYLPLYYWEDCGADRPRDPHLVQGVRSTTWGTEPHQSVSKHPSEVVYRFTDLNPDVDYEIKAQFYHEHGLGLKQRMMVDDTVIREGIDVTAEMTEVNWLPLPRETYSDGRVDVRIARSSGDSEAVISQLWMRERNYDPDNPPVNLQDRESIPEDYVLMQNYPNPFNPTTTIQFGVPSGATETVTLRIVNVLGQTVRVLVDRPLAPGHHAVVWDGTDASGRHVASGIYLYQLTAGDFTAVKKLMLMK